MAAKCGQDCRYCELYKEKVCLGCEAQLQSIFGNACPVKECVESDSCRNCEKYRCDIHRQYAVRVQDGIISPEDLIASYEDFVRRVDELGFMLLCENKWGIPSLSAETPENHWHTGVSSTDPWLWRIQAVENKDLAYGCIVGGFRGFVAPRLYPIFFGHYRPKQNLAELWHKGVVPKINWDLWQLFSDQSTLVSSDIRKALKSNYGVSQIEKAIRDLERKYYITVSGARHKLNKHGQPYGWPAAVYSITESWVDSKFGISNCPPLDVAHKELRQTFLDLGIKDQKILKKFDLN